jgi:protoporphyrinogen oxidase
VSETSADLAVVGAGPAGLLAAWRAALTGRRVVVLERAPVVGGMAGSFEVAGLRVDHGSHRLHPSIAPELRQVLGSLLGDDLQVRPRAGRIRLADRWVAFPLRSGDLARRLPRRFAAHAALDAVTGPLRRRRDDTFGEVVRAGLGPTVSREFYEPYVRKLWGVDAAELSGELARRRVSAASPGDVVRRLRRGADPSGRTFLYPRRGFGQICEALAEAVVDAGGEVRLGARVERLVRREHGTWEVRADGAEPLHVGRVWSTAPAAALVHAVRPGPPAAVLEAAGRLRHRGMVLVYLVVPRPRWTPFDAHYFPAEDLVFSRVSEPRNYRDSAEDPDDVTVLCAEVPATEGDRRWDATPEELGALVAGQLVAQGLPEPAHVAVEVRRLPRVYPQYRVGYDADLAEVERWVAHQPGLLTFGRQGLFVPDNTHHALAMGWAAAACLQRGGGFDEVGWARAREGFRTHVVED